MVEAPSDSRGNGGSGGAEGGLRRLTGASGRHDADYPNTLGCSTNTSRRLSRWCTMKGVMYGRWRQYERPAGVARPVTWALTSCTTTCTRLQHAHGGGGPAPASGRWRATRRFPTAQSSLGTASGPVTRPCSSRSDAAEIDRACEAFHGISVSWYAPTRTSYARVGWIASGLRSMPCSNANYLKQWSPASIPGTLRSTLYA